MVSMSSQNRDLFKFLNKEQACSQVKYDCEPNRCKQCPLYTPVALSTRYYNMLFDILKARDPSLLFVEKLNNLLSGGQENESSNDFRR